MPGVIGMSVWKATVLAGAIGLCILGSAEAAERSVRIDAHLQAELTTDHQIVLHVTPHDGDAWSRLALRVCGDASRWEELAERNGRGPNLLRGVPVAVPFDLLKPDLRLTVIRALFPRDQRHERGWIHQVVSESGPEGESLWRLGEWFAGSGESYAEIRGANPGASLSTKVGQRILIPHEILREEFRAHPVETRGAAGMSPTAVPVGLPARTDPSAPAEGAPLGYAGSGADRHAVYRLREGEALYSAVALRFTGRVHAEDVNEAIAELVRFNGIVDVSKLPVGYPVRIPLDLLTAEFRPEDDPERIAWERQRRQRDMLARNVEARRLEGVHVIIDPGHGGRDVGAVFRDMYESVYVYDIAVRLKTILESETGATVWVTTRSRSLGYGIPDRDVLEHRNDQALLTTPNYNLDDPVVGVNLRWYLSNAIYRRVVESSSAEKVVFISLHADSLHPSLRGAMVYIPGERHVRDLTFEKEGPVYLARYEVREQPRISHTAQEAFEAEALSNRFAESLMSAFRRSGLEVHPFDPIREHVVRDKKEWVPAVIRYNKVPTRVLLEVCNLANPEDRARLATRRWRAEVASSIAEGIASHFRRGSAVVEPSTVTAAR